MIPAIKALAIVLFAFSLLMRNPLLFLLAAMLALVAGMTAVWGRYALAGVTYTRRLGAQRLFAGEETDLWIELVNAKPLPLAWLKSNDGFPAEVDLAKGILRSTHKETRMVLVNLLPMRFYERVRKHYHLQANRRGAFEFGPAELRSGDMFGLKTQQTISPHIDWLIVYPKVVPITALGLPAAHPFGEAKTARRVAEDPLRLVGTRPYVPGDSPRRIHWKATAHHAALQSKVFDPSAAQVSAIFMDVQTLAQGYQGVVPDYLEYGIVAAASVARYILDTREAVGLYANGVRRNEAARLRLPPSRRPDHWVSLLESLAMLNSLALGALDRYLLAEMSALPFGSGVIAISAVSSDDLIAALLDAKKAGHPATLIAIGEHAPSNVPDDLRMYWIGGHSAYRNLTQLDLKA